MRQMKMAGTPEWSALTDSVKQDLAELPSFKAQALSARMQAHAGRVQRLIAAHEGMMKGMR
jgi:non-ribosomal peptide synthetase component F